MMKKEIFFMLEMLASKLETSDELEEQYFYGYMQCIEDLRNIQELKKRNII